MTRDCKHGQLARVCPICELEREIELTKAVVDVARVRIRVGHSEDCDATFFPHGTCDCGHDQLEDALRALDEARGWDDGR